MAQYQGSLYIKVKQKELWKKLLKLDTTKYGLADSQTLFKDRNNKVLNLKDWSIYEWELKELVEEVNNILKKDCIIFGYTTNFNVDYYSYVVYYLGDKVVSNDFNIEDWDDDNDEEKVSNMYNLAFSMEINSIEDCLNYCLESKEIKFTSKEKENVELFGIKVFSLNKNEKKFIGEIKKFINEKLDNAVSVSEYEKIIFDENSNVIHIIAKVLGTQYESRKDNLKLINNDNEIKLIREPENIYNSNNIMVQDLDGNILGNLKAILCNTISPYIDSASFEISNAKGCKIEHLSETDIRCKDAIMYVDFDLVIKSFEIDTNIDTSELIIPEGIVDIDKNYCWNTSVDVSETKTLVISNTVKKMDLGFFSNLEKIVLAQNNKYFKMVEDVLYTSDMKTLIFFPPTKVFQDYKISKEVEVISLKAFSRCKIKNLYLTKNINTISSRAFIESEIENIYCEDDIKSLDDFAFSWVKCNLYCQKDSNVSNIIKKMKKDFRGTGMFDGCKLCYKKNDSLNSK